MTDTRTSKPQSKSFPKTDVRYWRDKLVTRSNDDYHVRVAYAGRQERFPLRTANKEEGAKKARDIYLSLHANGWEKTLAEFKPWTAEAQDDGGDLTVGKFIDAVRAVAGVRATTFTTYERKFRFLVSQVQRISGGKERHDYVNGGSDKWREKINAIRLADITPEEVTKWRVRYISEAKTPLETNAARQTAASIIRNAKALFNPKLLQHLKGYSLPTPLPFDGVELGKRPRTRYKSNVNAALVVRLAHEALRPTKPELFTIFLLAFGAGLRRGEIDKLTWKQIDWTKGVVSIETTEYGDTKTEGSKEEIDLGTDMLAYLKEQFVNSKSPFVVASSVEIKDQPKHWNHYRCDHHFKELIDWLRANGVTVRNPIHTLRKEFGSLINQKFGIYAASAALRHSSITITREHYVDKKERVALDLGELMKGAA